MLLALLAGRGGFRLVQYGSTLLLLPVWGTQRYAVFAAALAVFNWVVALTASGPEKAALKLLPRAPRTGPAIMGFLLAVALALPVLPVALIAAVPLAGWSERTAVFVAVCAMNVCAGCNLLLVGLARASGHPAWDARNYHTLSAVMVALLVAAAFAGLGPFGYAAGIAVAMLALNLTLAARLGVAPSLRIRRRPVLLRRLLWTIGLMGGAELLLYVSTSVLFTQLTASRFAEQAGPLYAVMLISSAMVNVLIYVLRVYAPGTSLRQAGRGAATGRLRAVLAARAAAALATGWLVVVGVLLATTDLGRPASPTAVAVTAGVLLVLRTPALVLAVVAGYLLENTDAGAVRTVALSAAVGLAATAAAGFVLVPTYGAVGVVCAGALFELGQSTTIAILGRRRRVRT
jgi:hypothetical protein